MSKKCAICNQYTMFHIWSTSANLDKYKALLSMSLENFIDYNKVESFVVCMYCCHKNKLLSKKLSEGKYPSDIPSWATPKEIYKL